MPVSSVTEHWIKPDAVTINLNHFGDPDYLQVSVLAGAVVMAFKQDVIAYNAAHNYRTWPLQAANTYLETTSAYNVYARLTRSEVNASALIVYDPILRDIEGRPISLSENGEEVLGDADSTYFYVFLGQISSSIESSGQSTSREWIVDFRFGQLNTSEQLNDVNALLFKLFTPHFEDPLDPSKLTWIEAKSHIGVNGGVTMFVANDDIDLPVIYDGLPIDGQTLVWEETSDGKILKINPNIDLGGASSWSELEGKPSWITDSKPIYNYSEIKNTPDLSVFVTGTALSKTLADYATLIYLTGELKKYVTIKDDQDIVGVKNFLNGIKISNMPIRKLQDDVIYIDANLVVRGGVTMYSDNEVDIPSIKDEIGFAGYNGSVGLASFDSSQFVISANGTVSIKGGSAGLDTAQLKDYLDSNKYTTETWVKEQGYASASSLSSLQNRVNDFLEGSDTDTIINKWKELEAFLSGLSESDNLATILATKWTTDNSLINNWNTAYRWGNHASVGYALKSYVDETFVTLGTKQTITGEKNFTGGLKVNGSPIYYDATNKYWKLEGDLLVTGGVTMYGTDEGDLPSILDSLPIASNTALGIASFDSTYFSVDSNGMVSLTSAPSSGASSLGELLNVDASIDATASVDRILYQPQGSSVWTWRELPKDGVVGNYLPLSGGTLNGSLLVQANPSEWLFTAKTNTSVMYAAHADNYGIFASTKSASSEHYLLRLHYNDHTLEGSGSTAMVVKCNGVVAIGNMSSNYALNVEGDIYGTNWLRTNKGWHNDSYGGGFYMEDTTYLRTYGGKIMYIQEDGLASSNAYGIGGHTLQLLIGGSMSNHSSILLRSNTCGWGIASNTNGNMYIGKRPSTNPTDHSSDSYILELSSSGLICYGGITLYSDQRKKTILNHVELSLKQIADAPLIEHYYNSDQDKTTHVGSIAQYWASMNDWFCKLDSEGFYTMEIQNCALASAISIARHLEKYESKTDKKIRMLKKRVQELEEEVERLKQN